MPWQRLALCPAHIPACRAHTAPLTVRAHTAPLTVSQPVPHRRPHLLRNIPLPDPSTVKSAAGLATPAGYSGYGAEQGQGALREALASARPALRPPAVLLPSSLCSCCALRYMRHEGPDGPSLRPRRDLLPVWQHQALRALRLRRLQVRLRSLPSAFCRTSLPIPAAGLPLTSPPAPPPHVTHRRCDLTRLQVMFGPEHTIALQDPAYPVGRARVPGCCSEAPHQQSLAATPVATLRRGGVRECERVS